MVPYFENPLTRNISYSMINEVTAHLTGNFNGRHVPCTLGFITTAFVFIIIYYFFVIITCTEQNKQHEAE